MKPLIIFGVTMQDKILHIIIEILQELNEELNNPALENPSPDTILYGNGGILDSLALVMLIRDIEERISDEFGQEMILVDERAMSQRISPFRSVSTLANYIKRLLT